VLLGLNAGISGLAVYEAVALEMQKLMGAAAVFQHTRRRCSDALARAPNIAGTLAQRDVAR